VCLCVVHLYLELRDALLLRREFLVQGPLQGGNLRAQRLPRLSLWMHAHTYVRVAPSHAVRGHLTREALSADCVRRSCSVLAWRERTCINICFSRACNLLSSSCILAGCGEAVADKFSSSGRLARNGVGSLGAGITACVAVVSFFCSRATRSEKTARSSAGVAFFILCICGPRCKQRAPSSQGSYPAYLPTVCSCSRSKTETCDSRIKRSVTCSLRGSLTLRRSLS
jgi:hypothetical protein